MTPARGYSRYFSPSRVFVEIGEQVVDGLIIGLQNRTEQARVTARDMAMAVIDGVTGDMARLPELLGHVTDDVLLELDRLRADAEERLALARIAGASPEDIARLEAELRSVGAVIEAWALQTGRTVDEVFQENAISEKTVELWEERLNNLADVLDGSLHEKLTAQLASLQEQLAFALATGAPEAIIAGLEAQIAEGRGRLATGGRGHASRHRRRPGRKRGRLAGPAGRLRRPAEW